MLGEQQSALTYGIQGSTDYAVSNLRFGAEGEPVFNPTVQWKGSDGTFTEQAPEGISTAFSSDLKKLTVTAANTVDAGAYIFKTVSAKEDGLPGNYESTGAKLTIDKGESSNKEMAVRILSNTAKDNKTIMLPDISGAEYGKPTVTTSNGLFIGTPAVKDKTLTMNVAAKDDGTFETITIPVTKAKNYKDYTLTVTVTAKDSLEYSVTGSNTVKVTGFTKGKSSSKVTIPSTVSSAGKVYKVTAVGDKAFYKNSKITKASIGNNVTIIGKNAFKNCSKLQEVSIGNKVAELSDSAFYGCQSLKKVTIGTGLKKLGSHVFCRDKKLTKLTIKSKKLTKIGKHNLYQCHDLKMEVHSSK